MLHWRAVPPAEWHGPDLAYLGKKRRITSLDLKKLFGRGKKSRDAAHDDLEMKARCLAYGESCIPIQ